MEYGRYVGRVGALAVALGIGVAVANGGVANATTDPDPSQDVSDTVGQDSPTVDNSDTDTPLDSEGPETPTVVINGVDQNDDEGATTHRRVRPRVMILDVLRGANILGARRAEQNPGPVKQPALDEEEQKQQPVGVPNGMAVAKFAAPAGSDPGNRAVPGTRALQRTIGAITASTQQKVITPKVLPGPTTTATVVDNLTNQAQRQAATIASPSTLVTPTVEPVAPKPGRTVISLLSSIGLRPDAFPPSSPLAPIGQILEFVYAGLRRFDRTFFNETPTATPLIVDTNTKTGVVTGRVATDYEGDALVYRVVDAPDDGEVVFNPDGTFTYTPDRNQTHEVGETDEFTVVVSDRTNFHLHLLSPSWHETTVTVSNIPVVPNNTVFDSVDTGGQPEDLAINSTGTRVYVTDQDLDEVHVIDTSTNTIVASVPVSHNPDGLAVVKTPDGKEYVYVASSEGVLGDPTNPSNDIVSVIDTSTNTVVATIDLSPPSPTPTVGGLQEVAASSDGTKVYVTGFRAVYVIDTATNTQTAVIPMTSLSNSIAIARTPAGDFAYVADYDDKVTVINMATNAKVTTIAVPGFNTNIAASPDGRYVYVGGGDDGVTVIDTDTNIVVGSVSGVGDARGLTVSPDGSRLYVTQINFDRVAIVNTETLAVVNSVPLEGAWNIVAAPDGTRAYAVAFTGDPNVSVIALQAPPIEI